MNNVDDILNALYKTDLPKSYKTDISLAMYNFRKDEEPSTQGEKLAVELGLQMNFRNWLFKSYYVSAGDTNELPQLTMNYIYYKKDSE